MRVRTVAPSFLLPVPAARPAEAPRPRVAADFTKSLIEMNRVPAGSRALQLAVSIVLHVLVIGVPLLLSLWYTDTLNLRAYTATLLVGPPPPPPPPPAAAALVRTPAPRRVFTAGGKLLAPSFIPKQVAVLREAPLPDVSGIEGVAGGVPGGVPGGQMGGVLGGVLGGILSNKAVVPPPAAKAKTPVRIGGRVRPPRALLKTAPDYPVLARSAHIQGDVIIDATIDAQGNVVDARVVSGHPLLYDAAMNAVRMWKYEPTYLNDEPVPVLMNVTVSFRMQ
ncbi:MAG: energy transducer TonB [Acidobacteriia bacterium]|nr:energy transducer TonB [Terriglobia bacterium]